MTERRTQAERRSRSEEALLDAAARLIAEHGVEGTSLANIGTQAGLSRGLPSSHFGSKGALVASLVARAQDRLEFAMRARAEGQNGHTYDELTGLSIIELALDSYLEFIADPTSDQHALLVIWGSTFPRDADISGITKAQRRSYDGIADVISLGQTDGSIRSDIDPMASAVILLGMMRGISGVILADSSLVDISRVRATCQVLVRGQLANSSQANGRTKRAAVRAPKKAARRS